MELKRDEIINELDVQIKYAKFTNTNGVLLSAKAAQFCLEHAQFYEQKIKQLTEENERLRDDLAEAEAEAEKAVDIAEDNIRAELASGGTSCHWCENKVKSDTVKEVYRWLEGKNIANAGMLWRLCKDFKKQFGLEGDDEKS